MNETKILSYILEWNTSSNVGKIILDLEDAEPRSIENLNFEKFSAITKVLEKSNAWIRNNNIIYNKFL
ncbi:hypothetical protein PGH12_14425 [Chryseobacterium wangxinyae]|uniref:hypothetical protein n=1 Tax=Chryseobacterium sp. CY350 TaxID=2997336 RepID=UPI002271D4C7|nr:hypothetical protein [Chryseobacterium sp. CY350]MCY0975732.1 hypothetical protein [Chryseobacterium sp. CY350]WBZ94658.1 hypothetical protein PGH12_14425 [Chryseobacterium sp. CY350]